jgi:hypothetical protein
VPEARYRAPLRAREPGALRLWSPRPRVRVPSLTPPNRLQFDGFRASPVLRRLDGVQRRVNSPAAPARFRRLTARRRAKPGACAPDTVRAWSAVSAYADERVGHSATEPTGQERGGPAAGTRGEGRRTRAARAPSLRAAPRGDAHRVSRGLHPVSLPGPRLRGGSAAAPRRTGHDLVPAQLSAVLRAARTGKRGTGSSR